MTGPKNATLSGDGFRFYRWHDPVTGEDTDVLSVTSIRKLCGEPFTLVNWQIANVIDVAMSTVKRTVIGPRGGVKEVRVKDEYPGEFVRRYDATKGQQAALDDLRKWLRAQADAPRNIAAMRGTIVHAAIEGNIMAEAIERPYVELEFSKLSKRDRDRAKDGVTDEDVDFVRSAVRQYWDMRGQVPFTIIARELQVFNLTAGYAGSFDALVWLHPEGFTGKPPRAHSVTLDWVRENGGTLALLDWKTSKGVYTDQVVQAHAYMSAEFVGTDGVRDERMTDLLVATKVGGLVHVRPDKWGVHLFDYQPKVAYAFLGSVAFARFLALHPEPEALFSEALSRSGSAPAEEE